MRVKSRIPPTQLRYVKSTSCKKRIQTMNQFLHHLTEDAMPVLIEKLAEAKTE